MVRIVWRKTTVKIDDPDSPLTRSFGGKSFTRVDEFYHFLPTGPYSREKLRVLLALDTERSETSNEGLRPDRDYGLSWDQAGREGSRVLHRAGTHADTVRHASPRRTRARGDPVRAR